MIRLTEDMTRLINRARDDGYPCIVATASADGTPNAGYIGTVLAMNGDTLVYRDRTMREPLEHIEENPKVVVLFRNAAAGDGAGVGWKFRCTASVVRDGEVYDDLTRRLADAGLITDPALGGAIVILRVDQALTLFGEVLQEREPGMRW